MSMIQFPKLEQICDITSQQLEACLHLLSATQQLQLKHQQLFFAIQAQLEQRQGYDELLQFFDEKNLQKMNRLANYNPYADKLKNFNNRLEQMVNNGQQRKKLLRNQQFGVRVAKKITEKQKSQINSYIQKTFLKTKVTDHRVVQVTKQPQRPKERSLKALPVIVQKPLKNDKISKIKSMARGLKMPLKNELIKKPFAQQRKLTANSQTVQFRTSLQSSKTTNQSNQNTRSSRLITPLRNTVSLVTPQKQFRSREPQKLSQVSSERQKQLERRSQHKQQQKSSRKKSIPRGEESREDQAEQNQFLQAPIRDTLNSQPKFTQHQNSIQNISEADSLQMSKRKPRQLMFCLVLESTQNFKGKPDTNNLQLSPDRPKLKSHHIQIKPQKEPEIESFSQTKEDKSEQKSSFRQSNSTVKIREMKKPRVTDKCLTKINNSLPDNLVDYSAFIPSFQNLFYGCKLQNFDLMATMREKLQIFRLHITQVDHQAPDIINKRSMAHNKCAVQNYYHDDPQKIYQFSQETNIDIRKFIERQRIFVDRISGNYSMEQSQILYFRAIKSKQQVYDIVGRTFYRRNNWAELPHAMNLKSSWNLLWTWSRPQIQLSKLLVFQKINHFPNNKHLVKKDYLKKRIEQVRSLGTKANQLFKITPLTYVLPKEYCKFVDSFLQHESQQINYWIMKPVGKSRGRGITLVKSLSQVLYSQPVIIQQYLKDPLLLGGRKFDLRVYVLVTSFQPLQAFIYNQGFARLTTEQYSLQQQTLNNNFVHLTNYAIQKNNPKFKNSIGGSKISLKMLAQNLSDRGISWTNIWDQVIDIVVKSLVACNSQIGNSPSAFQLFGYDIIIDRHQKCWLLQVNSSPSLQRDYILDDLIKQQLMDDIIDVLDPPYFDRGRLAEVLDRRLKQMEGRKSNINTLNKSKQQLKRDLNYILKGKALRQVGEMPKKLGGFSMVAPSELSKKLLRLIQSYKVKQ